MAVRPPRREETPAPVINRIEAGLFHERSGYATYRSAGTADWLIIHTLAGRGRFGAADGTEVPARPGDVTLLAPRVRHDYGVEPELEHWDFLFAHFHPLPDWRPLLDWPQPAPGVLHIHAEDEADRRIADSLRQAVFYSHSGMPHAELFAVNALETALLWCQTQMPHTRQLDERILRVLRHIEAHLTEPLSAAGLARVAGLSASRFAHLFTHQVGTSPQAFVEAQRMGHAMQLLELSQRPISEVARAVGYSDPLYFSTRFRRHTGQSPQQYRARRSGG